MFAFEVARDCAVFRDFGPRARELMRLFGMTVDGVARRAVRVRLSLRLEAGQICWIGGPSGAGKSLLLDALYDAAPPEQRVRIESIALRRDAAVIDCVDGPLEQTLEALSRAGLGDAWCLLRPPGMLSEGQQWRYRLAQAQISGRGLVFADEFCASLDATSARAVAYHLRRSADRTGCVFVLAGCREDVVDDLRPDVVVMAGQGVGIDD